MTDLHDDYPLLTFSEKKTRHKATKWGKLYGSSLTLAVERYVKHNQGVVLLVCPDNLTAQNLVRELQFFLADSTDTPILQFPDWETLPYDLFSPHQDIISDRIKALYHLPRMSSGILVLPVTTLMQRLAPRQYIEDNSLLIHKGDTLKIDELRRRLQEKGYQYVSQVMEHGDFSVRGSLIDLFPMGSSEPIRIDLFDDEIETIRTFDTETQLSIAEIEQLELLPAREFPAGDEGIAQFRHKYRTEFEGDPQRSQIYNDVSQGSIPSGIEYYLPLFFEQCSTLFDYLPENAHFFLYDEIENSAKQFWQEAIFRHEQLRHDQQRPVLSPDKLFLDSKELHLNIQQHPTIELQQNKFTPSSEHVNFATSAPPTLTFDAHQEVPSAKLRKFLNEFHGRLLFVAESSGRREVLLGLLKDAELYPSKFLTWSEFLNSTDKLGITVAPLDNGLILNEPALALITENQLFGQQVMQRRRRKKGAKDADQVIKSLAELTQGSPVVHQDHGVGLYLGLQTLDVGGLTTEFLTLEYAGGDKLYVPVATLHLISRYTGTSPENAPLHKLGSGQWERAKKKATERIRDVAAELLEVYAKREARQGFKYPLEPSQYAAFSADFPFEETPDQHETIEKVKEDMTSEKPMDRLVCGDVGFGKTEVAMRAAFIAAQGGKQVAILVPTTLLAQQHFQNFCDRFADWPVKIESLSRFRSKKEIDIVIEGLQDGTVDIVIGTHKLLQNDIRFKRLGLLIIDEEHRFGVQQKERFKKLRSEVDILSMTATPIPRTLNLSLSQIRDLSIIASPPAKRVTIKTFVSQWNDHLIQEAILREIKRGGQVYFLHNKVEDIEKIARTISELVPEASVRFAHGQMRERELEQAMLDFYHHRFNVLVCTTIIETGIDIPSANTILINRADRFGLAQLYQLRGRVGRSHHRAYAYLITPPKKVMTPDAIKRLEAIESIQELGAGFTLAIHDMEIRGAGELLGEDQSGQMQQIGFSLYTDLLERAVNALKEGKEFSADDPLNQQTEIELRIPALLPEDYMPDIHNRLILYKRISSAKNNNELRELQVEMIDRFGLLPDATKNLFHIAELKLQATPLGIKKIELSDAGGRFIFNKEPNIDPMLIIQLIQKQPKKFKLDGQDKLRIIADLPDIKDRFLLIEQLLTQLVPKQAAA